MLRRFILFGAMSVVAFCVLIAFWPSAHRPGPATTTTMTTKATKTIVATTRTTPIFSLPRLFGGPAPPVILPVGDCAGPAAMHAAAADNAVSLNARVWAPWGRAETGWDIYSPLIAAEVATACEPGSPGFAQSLSVWQLAHKLPADGMMTPEAFEKMRVMWLRRRPFVLAFTKANCPAAANPWELAPAAKAEGYLGKPIQLSIPTLASYRSMIAAARREVPEVAANPQLLTVFSGYRSPAEDEARCDRVGDCGTIARARCSAHRTGTAMDLYLGSAPGYKPESSEDPNRLFQSKSAAYRWLALNGQRFGFVPYPFEPWHWEWAGQAAS